jgi:CheY-like chemotaxis protein
MVDNTGDVPRIDQDGLRDEISREVFLCARGASRASLLVEDKHVSHRSSPGVSRIMIADTDKSAAQSLHFFLRLEGYEVRVVDSGEEAISTFCAFEPQAIVLPAELPDLQLRDVLEKLVQFPHYSAHLIVVIVDDLPEGALAELPATVQCHCVARNDHAGIVRVLCLKPQAKQRRFHRPTARLRIDQASRQAIPPAQSAGF